MCVSETGSGPQGVALDLAHQRWVEDALRRLAQGTGEQCLSDFSFSNLYLFRRTHDYRVHEGPWPFVSGKTYDGVRHAIPLFRIEEAPVQVLRELLRSAGADCLFPVPEHSVCALDPEKFVFEACRDDADYLYPADNFRHYRGTLLNKKRNLMRQLLATHQVRSAALRADHKDAAEQVLTRWMSDKGQPVGGADESPCLEALLHANRLGLEGFMHWVDGEPAGFVLAEPLQPGVFAMRFAKSLNACKGLAQYMFHHFCTEFRPPVQWLNFEQDLGLPNFRLTKQSYKPAALLAKYRVRLRGV